MAEFRYTPYLQQAGKTIGAGLESIGNTRLKQQVNALAGKAQMGDPQALQQLMEISPQTGMAIQQGLQRQKAATDQKNLQSQTAVAGEMKSAQVEARRIEENAAKFGTYEEANVYVKQETQKLAQQYPMLMQKHPEIFDPNQETYTPEDYAQSKTVYGKAPEESSGAFAGKSEFAQVNNMLVRGATDTDFRNTPEYAAAWQAATEPKVVRTPTGDILQKPSIDKRFKPPGSNAFKEPIPIAEVESSSAPPEDQPGEPKSSIVIPGTEKISTDQKAYNKDYTLLKKSYDSMQNYIDILGELGPQMSVGPLNTKDTQTLESAYARAMLDAKETNGLGVLNGPDVGIIRKLMGDPTGFTGQIRGKDALLNGATEAMRQITDNFDSLNNVVGDTPVKTRILEKQGKKKLNALNEEDLSVTIDGERLVFPSLERYNAYKAAVEAAGGL